MSAVRAPVQASWWHERIPGPGLATVLDARRLRHARGAGLEVELLDHDRLGWILALDGRIHHAEADAGPREMLVHVPLLGRSRPGARVLVVGGGDGAVLREVLRHDTISRVDLLEPEPDLLDLAGAIGNGAALADPRVHVTDVLPDGPWEVILLDRPLLGVAALAARLTADGVVCESDHVVLGLARPTWLRRGERMERPGHEERYLTISPLAAGGFVGYSLHTHDGASHREPCADLEASHYNAGLHRAAFALPPFWKELP